MKRNRRRKPRKIVITAIIVAFILGGGVSAYAATGGVKLAYYEVYENTVEKREEPPVIRNRQKEHEGFVEDYAEMKFIRNNEVSGTNSVDGTINWSVGHNAMRCTGEFPVNADRKIKVQINLGSGNRTVMAGIMKPDGKISYVCGKNSISHTFYISKAGNYRVFVSNRSGRDVTVRGFYVRPAFCLVSREAGNRVCGRFHDAATDGPAQIAIRNLNENNQVIVTYTMAPDSDNMAAKIEICKDSDGKSVVASTTFHGTQPHSAEFILPADQTYYARITPVGTQSVSGNFTAEY